jgi:hypothetical protein
VGTAESQANNFYQNFWNLPPIGTTELRIAAISQSTQVRLLVHEDTKTGNRDITQTINGICMRKIFNNCLFIALLSTTPLTAWSYSLNVNVDTSSLAGTNASLAFDFIDGDGAVNNTVHVSNFLRGHF